jgi:hypothetical protein
MNNRQTDFFVDFSDSDDNIPMTHDIISHFNMINPNAPTLNDIVTDIRKNDIAFDKNWLVVGTTLIIIVACKYDEIMECQQINELVNNLISMKSFVEQIKNIDPNINEKNLKIYALAFFMCMMLIAQHQGNNLDTSNLKNILQQHQNHDNSYMIAE